MSNQTFVKKDRISFAQNLNEQIAIAPFTNALYIGPNSAITYDANSNVQTINTLAGVTLSNQYIYADGTYLSNLPTGITQDNITSTITGLGSIGYVSSSQLTSTVTGLGTSGSPATWANYPAINTVNVAGNIISNTDTILVNSISSATSGFTEFLNFVNFQNHDIYGVTNLQADSFSANNYGNIRFDTSVNMNAQEISNINNLYFGYSITTTYKDGLYMTEYTAPDSSVKSPALGLYANSIPFVGTSADNTLVNLYNVNSIWVNNINTSSISGDGSKLFNLNAISSLSLQSTVTGLGNLGYISSSQLTSTVTGLGSFGYISSLRVSTLFISTLIASSVSTTLLYASTAIMTNILDQYQYIKSATNDWSWIVRNWTNSPGSNQMNAPTALFSSFYESESRVASNTRFQHTASLNSVTNITYGGLTNYKAIATSYIQVITPFTLTSVKFDVDDTGSLWDNGNYIIGQSAYNGGTGTLYNYYFTVGWHRLDLIWYQGGGGDYVQLGWNPANYRNNIAMMSAYGPNDRITNYLGNVGIGLPYPSTTLDVGGVIRAPFLSTILLNVNTISSGVNVTFANGIVVSSINTNSISSGNIITSNISSFFYGGIEKYNYISSIALQSTITGLGTFGYLSTNTVPSTIIGLGTFGYRSSFNSISSLNISSGNAFVNLISTQNINASTMTLDKLFAGPAVGATITQNLYPFSAGSKIGFGATTTQGGTYEEGHFRSTFTQVIQPTLDNDGFSNIVRINGSVSTPNMFTSTIFNRNFISTPVVVCSNLTGIGTGNSIFCQNLYPQGINILGFGTGGPGNGPWDSASIRQTLTSSITTNNISTGVGFISSLTVNSLTIGSGAGWVDFGAIRAVIVSSIQTNTGLLNASSIRGDGSQIYNLPAISSLSIQSTIIGLGTFGYLSTNTVPSTIIGLGTFGYISTNTVPSTIIGLGTFGYISSLNSISSLNISSGNVFADAISTLNINASTMTLDKLFAGPIVGATITQNLYPFSAGSKIGFGATTAEGGTYEEGHFRSTFTQVIQPTLDNDGFSNIVIINGNISTPNIFVSTLRVNTITASTIFVSTLSTHTITTAFLTGAGSIAGNQLYTNTLLPNFQIGGGVFIGNNTTTNSFRGVYTFSTFTQVIQPSLDAGVNSNIVRIQGNTLAQNINTSTIFASTVSTHLITTAFLAGAGAVAGPAIYTATLLPNGTVNIGNTGNNFYSQGCFNSTFTQVIEPRTDVSVPARNSNVLRINGFVSTQQIFTSSIFARANISTQTFLGSNVFVNTLEPYNTTRINAAFIIPIADATPGLAYEFGSAGNRWGRVFTNSTITNTITPMVGSVVPNPGVFDINSTIRMFGTVSTQNQVVSTINIQSLLTAKSIIGDGSQIYNLPAISSLSLESTIVGLGAFGYLSTNIVPSTIVGLGAFGYLSTNIVPSTIVGLGAFGYLSTNIVPSTIVGLGAFGYLSTNIVPSTIVGLGAFGYLSTNIVPSTIVGLGTFGYISSSQLNSTITGLGTFGYISSSQLISTTIGLADQTNLVVSQSYSNLINTTEFNKTSFTQLLTSFPSRLTYKNTNKVFTNVWQVSFSFSGDLSSDDNIAYYFSLSNMSQTFETTGNNFNSSKPKYIRTPNNFTGLNKKSLSDSYTDAYNLLSWNHDDLYCVLLYFQGETINPNRFDDTITQCIYTSFIQPSIKYET